MNETRLDGKKLTARCNWKLTDIWGQVGTLVLPCLCYIFLDGSSADINTMFISMVSANIGWVAISLIAHIRIWRAPWIILGRKILAVIYLLIVVSELLYMAFVAPHNTGGRSGPPTHAVIMLGLMALVPLMGIPYFLISILELNRLNARIRNASSLTARDTKDAGEDV